MYRACRIWALSARLSSCGLALAGRLVLKAFPAHVLPSILITPVFFCAAPWCSSVALLYSHRPSESRSLGEGQVKGMGKKRRDKKKDRAHSELLKLGASRTANAPAPNYVVSTYPSRWAAAGGRKPDTKEDF
ncbi:hypothetical protein IF1G_04855 [Cordyceps javanica]|uniref:Uncharacterized protein n=1 Tax=Cordyceps javanica TaxID=43265 RepID=A0A545V3I6_9HYPO|nr:hypothetical protein IF1G_04855 [Cordyceps javanica]